MKAIKTKYFGPGNVRGRYIARLMHAPHGATIAEVQANARLIAASPELLEACQDAYEHLSCRVRPGKSLKATEAP